MMQAINRKAPALCAKEISIHASAEKVWTVLTDIPNWIKWNREISQVQLDGPLQPGTRFVWKTGGAKIRSTLHTVEPFRHFGWTGKAMGAYAIHNWMLTEINGQTKVSVEESMDGLLVKVLRGMFNKNLEKGMQSWLELLKQECER